MKITSLVPWYGSKRSMAPLIVDALGKHNAYWEPFCGSMAVLLNKPRSSHETVVDLHGDLINLAWVLQSKRWAEFHDRCARSVITEDMHQHAVEVVAAPFVVRHHVGDEELERAYWFFIESWWGRNGLTGSVGTGKSLAVRYTSGGGHGGVRFQSVTQSIPAWHERLRSTLILNGDGLAHLDRIADQRGTAIYCDPPYLTKSAKYKHDFRAEKHAQLAEILQRFTRARVVVSYYDHPALAELYPADRWTKLRCDRHKHLAYGGENGPPAGTKTIAPEILLVNATTNTLF